jgi:tRNA(fMet)-specific endonuclease VapC
VNKALLDTDVFSEILKKKNPAILANATNYLRHHQRFTLSVLNVIEIVAGYRQARRGAQLQSFYAALAANEILPIGPDEAHIAGDILGELRRTGQTIGHFDPMIAAVAIANNLTLVTGNNEHFERIRQLGYELTLENWREPLA